MKYSRDENGYFVSQAKTDAIQEYEKLKLTNRSFEYADERTKKMTAHMSDYYLKNVPDDVVEVWWESIEETGINPFPEGYTGVLQQLSMEKDFLSAGIDDVFGNSKESCIEAVEKILERLDISIGKTTNDNTTFRVAEREFYVALLEKIKG